MLNYWVISDPHFGHTRIEELASRPEGWEERLIANWNRVVSPADTVLSLGDFMLTSKERFASLMNTLNYKRIILIKGNHDKRSKSFFKEFNIELVNSKWIEYNNILLSHYPLHRKEIPKGYYNVHGHIHNNSVNDGVHFNVCVEKMDYCPVTLRDIIKKFNLELH